MRPAVSPLHSGLITGVSCRHGAKGVGTTGDVNVKEIINDLTLSQMLDGWPDAVTVPESGFVYVTDARP